jgi:hypothetical protein
MSVQYIPVGKLRGEREIGIQDLVPRTQPKGHQHSSVTYNQTIPFKDVGAPNIMNDAIQRPTALMTKPCKDEPFSIRKSYRPPIQISSTNGLYPITGVFRHEKKGLAYDPNKPNNLPLTPKPNGFYAGMNSKIPQVK